MGDVTSFSFAEYSIEHSRSTEQSDMATMQWCERTAFDVIHLGQKHTSRLTVCGGFQQQVLHFVQWNAHVGQDNRLGIWNFVPNFRIVAQRLSLGLRRRRLQVAHSIQQDSIRNLGMPLASCCQHYDLFVFEASRLGEPEHSQIREVFA